MFVDGALPGERVDVAVDTTKKDFASAHVVTLHEPSPDRVVPPCPHRLAGCGGCDWMHLHPDAQLAAKVGIVTESLVRIGRFDADAVAATVRRGDAVSPLEYRTSIRVIGDVDGRPGYRAHGSTDVVPVDSCPIAVEPLSRLLAGLGVEPGVEVALRVSLATGATTAIWEGGPTAVRGLPTDAFTGSRAWLAEEVAGVALRVSAPSFFQSGVQGAELLVDAVSRAAPELAQADHVVDAYGGVGLFAATAARAAGHVTLIESSRFACRDAIRNLEGRSASVVRAEVGRWRPDPGPGPVDVVIADPARPGLAKPGVGVLARTGAAVLVLVSCDPVSLARDARLLAGEGYDLETVDVLDLFPETHHVETVSRFVRG